jgi:hypothetical protein
VVQTEQTDQELLTGLPNFAGVAGIAYICIGVHGWRKRSDKGGLCSAMASCDISELYLQRLHSHITLEPKLSLVLRPASLKNTNEVSLKPSTLTEAMELDSERIKVASVIDSL